MSQPHPHQLSAAQLTEVDSVLADLDSRSTLIYESADQAIHRFKVGELDLIAKSYQIRTFKQKLTALLRHSRAERSYRAGKRFIKAGIKTPRPLLLIRRESNHLLVNEYCPDPALLTILKDNETAELNSTPQQVLKLLHQLRELKCSHGDFHARNLLIDPQGQPTLIDLDGVRYPSSAKAILRDRDRLLQSLEPLPDHHATYLKALGAPGEALPSLTAL